ncbi:MAG: hypothetical protein U0V72_10310 [Cytophagales bacterium]
MYSISKKISIIGKANLLKNSFCNEEIGQTVVTKFSCCNCGHKNKIEITPYESGFPIFQIYNEEKVLSRSELIEKKVLQETSHWMKHYGELTLNDLPTLYFGIDCESCQSSFIAVFCYGEKQPGLTLLEISGVWQYEIRIG